MAQCVVVVDRTVKAGMPAIMKHAVLVHLGRKIPGTFIYQKIQIGRLHKVENTPTTIRPGRFEAYNFVAVAIPKHPVSREEMDGVGLFGNFKRFAKSPFPVDPEVVEVDFAMRNLRALI